MSPSIPAGRRTGPLARVLALAIGAVLVLGGCGSGESGKTATEAKADGASNSFPVAIKHAHGTTTIKEKPRRIVTLSWTSSPRSAPYRSGWTSSGAATRTGTPPGSAPRSRSSAGPCPRR
ncbi:hypothetical protein ACFW6N_14865 [Streptomyces cyaneofuscatus]|uniref:hypothetical protein n=1 Tax=Streptomyces cyaneofuscatus TaxID=66883 RepID=UPI00367D430D